MSIKVLSRDVVNQISAGEVVEKPASIVKELVENSIDADASSITIEIEKGGISRICVTDNGSGIHKDEIMLAFTPHATSKLEKIDDLDSLVTMGFRGEALATISAVSRVTLITKTKDEETGVRVEMEGSDEVYRGEVACVTGTKIDVKDIFFNTPARLKFLRKPKSEENDITNFVEKLMLSHPDISFKYIVDGKMIYNTSNCGILDNIYTIYGKDVANNVLEVNYSIGDYVVTGYVSKPEYSKSNRTYQNLFVNNRFCNNSLVSTAVANAYDQFTMKGKFPLYVLFLSLPQYEVDVNVHPNKLEVKFINTQKVFKLCSDAVFKALSDFNHIKNIDEDNEKLQTNISYANISPNEGVSYINFNKQARSYTFDQIKKGDDNSKKAFLNDDDSAYKNIDKDHVLDEDFSSFFTNNKSTGAITFELTDDLLLPEINLKDEEFKPFVNVEKPKEVIISQNVHKEEQGNYNSLFDSNYKIVGKIFNTYLILELDNKIYFIDQHAAHERQRYDALMVAIDENKLEIQSLLFPYTFHTSTAESNFLIENIDVLNDFGIEIYQFGDNCFKISSVPLILADIDMKVFVDELLLNISGYVRSPKEIIKEKFMQMACKSAVKGGDDLKDIEIKSLLDNLKTKVLLCPHGRPIVVEITEKQIEKWFKRIV